MHFAQLYELENLYKKQFYDYLKSHPHISAPVYSYKYGYNNRLLILNPYCQSYQLLNYRIEQTGYVKEDDGWEYLETTTYSAINKPDGTIIANAALQYNSHNGVPNIYGGTFFGNDLHEEDAGNLYCILERIAVGKYIDDRRLFIKHSITPATITPMISRIFNQKITSGTQLSLLFQDVSKFTYFMNLLLTLEYEYKIQDKIKKSELKMCKTVADICTMLHTLLCNGR